MRVVVGGLTHRGKISLVGLTKYSQGNFYQCKNQPINFLGAQCCLKWLIGDESYFEAKMNSFAEFPWCFISFREPSKHNSLSIINFNPKDFNR